MTVQKLINLLEDNFSKDEKVSFEMSLRNKIGTYHDEKMYVLKAEYIEGVATLLLMANEAEQVETDTAMEKALKSMAAKEKQKAIDEYTAISHAHKNEYIKYRKIEN